MQREPDDTSTGVPDNPKLQPKPPSSMLRTLLRAATCGYMEPHAPVSAARMSERTISASHAARTGTSVDAQASNHQQPTTAGLVNTLTAYATPSKQHKRRRLEKDHQHPHGLKWVTNCFRPRSRSPVAPAAATPAEPADRLRPDSLQLKSINHHDQRNEQQSGQQAAGSISAMEFEAAGTEAAANKNRKAKKPKHVRPTHFLAARVSHSEQVRPKYEASCLRTQQNPESQLGEAWRGCQLEVSVCGLQHMLCP